MMKKMSKKIAAIFMTFAILASLMPALTLPASAADFPGEITTSEKWSKNISEVFSCTIEANISFRNLAAINGGDTATAHAYIDLDEVSFDNNGTFALGYTTIGFSATASGTYTFDAYYDGTGESHSIEIIVRGDNTAPTVATSIGSTFYTEQADAVAIDSGITISDSDGDADWNAGTLTVQITANNTADDTLTLPTTNAGAIWLDTTDNKLMSNATQIGTADAASVSNSTAWTFTFNSNATSTLVTDTAKTILFSNSSDDPGTSRTITFTATDKNNGSASNTKTVSITCVNDAPTLTANALNPTFTEDGAAVTLFNTATVGNLESGQKVTELKLTVSNVTDGANETLIVDGKPVALASGSGTTNNNIAYSVSLVDGTSTITLSKADGLSDAQALTNGLLYRNTSNTPTTGSRVVTLTSIKDNGGTTSGMDTTALSIASTVPVAAVNDVPFTRDISSFLQLGANAGAKSAAGTYATAQLDNITLEAWIYLDNSSGAHHVFFNGNGASSGYGIYVSGATVNVLMGSVGWIVCSTGGSYNAANSAVLTVGQWTHIAATRNTIDGGTDGWKIYVNGHRLATQFNSAGGGSGIPNALNSSSYVQIGSSTYDPAGLSVSDARIWNRALTQAEIQANMSGTVAPNATGLAGYWKLNDGSGTTVPDIQTNQAALDLPITGSISWVASTAASTAEDTAISGRLAGGDIETSVTYAKASDSAHGTVSINENGSYTYTPAANFNGSDSFTFITSDGSANSASQVVNITVAPVNDAPTDISLDNTSIAEGAAADTIIGTLSTTDPDAGDKFTYSIQSVKDKNNHDISLDTFAINGSHLCTKAALSFSTNNSYTVVMRTSDGTTPFDKTFTITVTETNVAPTDISLTASSIAENSAIGTTIGTVSTTDANTPAPFSYTIVSGDTACFQISGNELQLNIVPDFETKKSYSITIKTTDNGGLTCEKAFIISVVNINEAPVVTASDGTSVFFEAKAGASTAVVVDSGLTVADVDSGTTLITVTAKISTNYNSAQDELSFTNDGSTMGNIAASFDSSTGVLTLTSENGTATLGQWQAALRAVNYTNTSHSPTVSTRTVTFSVSDGELSAAATRNVGITQANTAPTNIVLSSSSVAENSSIGTTVGTLTATDDDADDAYTCSLVAGYGDYASFTIEGVTATDYALNLAVSPNYEGKNSYSIRVRAKDIAGAAYDKDFTVTISDANDAPSITSEATASFAENGTGAVYTTAGADPDTGDTLTWSLDGADKALFSMDSDGKVTFNTVPNYEDKKDVDTDNVYNITVIATDCGGLTALKNVAITITNVNEAPEITTAAAFSVAEGSTTAFTAAASDPEGNAITWSITGGADAGKFRIVPSTGVVTFTTAPSYRTPADVDAHNDYVLEMTATDGTLSVAKTVTVTVAQNASGDGGSTTTYATNTVVEVNGQRQDAGTSETSTNSSGQTTTTVKVDDTKLNKLIESSGEKSTITLPSKGSDVTVGELNGQTVKNMEAKEATLEIRTETVTYTLPASQINIDAVSDRLGEQVALKDIKVSVKIAEPTADTVKIVEETASKGNYQLVVKPVEFEITCTSGDKMIEANKFNGYVERTIAIPDGVDSSKITTGIVLNADGSFRHVPTEIVIINGKYYAKINSLTNSTYSVIYNPVEFTDVAAHWAKAAINDMGSRMVVTGIGSNTYDPDRNITRGEFAAIVVRALGLPQGATESSFRDVALTDWFNGYVDTATSYSLITGYDSATYGPNDTITREQAMVILAKAMKLAGLSVSLTDREVSTLLASYTDRTTVSNYAQMSAAVCIKAGIVTGSSATTLSPKAYVTRAEVAVMVQCLLQKSGLI